MSVSVNLQHNAILEYNTGVICGLGRSMPVKSVADKHHRVMYRKVRPPTIVLVFVFELPGCATHSRQGRQISHNTTSYYEVDPELVVALRGCLIETWHHCIVFLKAQQMLVPLGAPRSDCW